MRLSAWLSPIGLLALVACHPPAARSAESILAASLPGLLEPPLSPACGSAPVPARPTRLLLVTARHCLSCRSMGLVMRRLALRAGGELAVFIPSRDAEAVCTFARQERLAIPIVAVSGPAFPAGALDDRFLYGEVDVRGAVTRAQLAEDAEEFFAHANGDVARPATGASPH